MKIFFNDIRINKVPITWDFDKLKNCAVCTNLTNQDKLYLLNFQGIIEQADEMVIPNATQFFLKYKPTLVKPQRLRYFDSKKRYSRLSCKDTPKILDLSITLPELLSQTSNPTLWANTLGWNDHFENKRSVSTQQNRLVHTQISLVSQLSHEKNTAIGQVKKTILADLEALFDCLAKEFNTIEKNVHELAEAYHYFQTAIENILVIKPIIYENTQVEQFYINHPENGVMPNSIFTEINKALRIHFFKLLAEKSMEALFFLIDEPDVATPPPRIILKLTKALINYRDPIRQLLTAIQDKLIDYMRKEQTWFAKKIAFDTAFLTHTLEIPRCSSFYLLIQEFCLAYMSNYNLKNLKTGGVIPAVVNNSLDYLNLLYDGSLSIWLPFSPTKDTDFYIHDDLADLIKKAFYNSFLMQKKKKPLNEKALIECLTNQFKTSVTNLIKQKQQLTQLATDPSFEGTNEETICVYSGAF